MQMPDVFRAQELCVCVWKSRWTSWAPAPNIPTVSVDVKQHFIICTSASFFFRRLHNRIRCWTESYTGLCKPPDNGWVWVIYGVGSLCLSFTPVRHRKDYKRDVTFLYTLINLDRHRLIMIIIAGRAASEFLGLHKEPKNKTTKKRKG